MPGATASSAGMQSPDLSTQASAQPADLSGNGGSLFFDTLAAAASTLPPMHEQQTAQPQQRGTCVICMEQFRFGEHVAVLVCSHELHQECFDAAYAHIVNDNMS